MGFNMENRRFDAIEKADSGLEAYFRKIYAYVAGGLGLSALAAWAAELAALAFSCARTAAFWADCAATLAALAFVSAFLAAALAAWAPI